MLIIEVWTWLESGERKLAFISLGGRSYHPLGIHISSVVEWPLFCVVLSHYAVIYSVLLILWPKLDTSSINRQAVRSLLDLWPLSQSSHSDPLQILGGSEIFYSSLMTETFRVIFSSAVLRPNRWITMLYFCLLWGFACSQRKWRASLRLI